MDQKNSYNKAFKSVGRYGSLGIDLVANVSVGALLGYWLDKSTAKEPLFFIGGFFLGVISGFYRIFLLVKEESLNKK